MNQKLAKRLRRMAREEMSGDKNLVERELVVARVRGKDLVVNEPISVRAMHLKLKDAYKKARAKG